MRELFETEPQPGDEPEPGTPPPDEPEPEE
jgi:hypothetical protein